MELKYVFAKELKSLIEGIQNAEKKLEEIEMNGKYSEKYMSCIRSITILKAKMQQTEKLIIEFGLSVPIVYLEMNKLIEIKK